MEKIHNVINKTMKVQISGRSCESQDKEFEITGKFHQIMYGWITKL